MKKKFFFGEFAFNILKCFAYFITWYLISNFVATLYLILYRAFTSENNLDVLNNALSSHTVALTVIANCITIFVFLLFYHKKGTTLFERTDLKKTSISIGVHSFIFGAAFLLVVNVFLIILSKFAPEAWFSAHNQHSSVFTEADSTIKFLGAVVLAPILEEILFRGLIAKALNRNLHPWLAIILSSLVFGAVHGTIIGFIYASIIGAFMCWIYFKTNSLLSSILFHIGFNAISYFMTGSSIPLILVGISFLAVGYEIINFNRIDKKR